MKVKSESEVAQSCTTLHDPMDCSPPGSSIHGIFQARVLEWVAIAFKNTLEVINSRIPEAQEQISELEDKMVEITSEEQNKVKEAQRVPYKINPRRNMPRHILIKLTKTKHKERILKAARKSNKYNTRETSYA